MSVDGIRKLKADAARKKAAGPKKKVRIRPRTAKKAKENRTLALNYGPFLENNPVCQVQSDVCTQTSTAAHHKEGRSVDKVLDQKTWLAVCYPCHEKIHRDDAWARENGFLKSRHTKRES